MRVISHEKEERGLLGSFAPPVIVGEFGKWEILRPVVLLVVDEESEIRLHPLVILF
jgi:hypothetical protein